MRLLSGIGPVVSVSVRELRREDYPVTPWKNGLGITREVLRHPVGTTGETFDWRLSMAEVTADAPFSPFPGIERHLVVVAGGGLRLVIDGRRRTMGVGSDAVVFSGGAVVTARPVDEVVTDLNLMLREGAATGSLTPVGGGEVRGEPGWTVLVAVEDLHVRVEGSVHDLGRLDALLLVAGEPFVLEVAARGGGLPVLAVLARMTVPS